MTKIYDYKICKYDFFNTAIADILRAIDGGSLVGSLILCFCSIDYMGLALDPTKKNTRADFKKFVGEYMGVINPRYVQLNGEIYAVRNSLVHSYGESDATEDLKLDYHLSHLHPELHLTIQKNNERRRLFINLPNFVAELIGAVEKYFRDNFGNDELLKNWYYKLLIIQGADASLERLMIIKNAKFIHANSHTVLKVLDDEPKATLKEIADTIAKEITDKLYRIYGC